MIYIHKNDQQLGPFDESQIAKAIQEGQFTYEDLAWKEGLAEWVRLGDLLPKEKTIPQTPPPIPTPPQSATPTVIQTNVKQGAVIGGWVCFALGLATMFFSLWAFFIYAPLFLVAFILSIVAMVQRRILGGIILLLFTLIIPFPVSLYLGTSRLGAALMKDAHKQRAESDIEAISMSLKTYEMLNYSLPTNDQGLGALVEKPTSEPEPKHWKKLMKDVPLDPWGSKYVYRFPSKSGKGFDLFSLGPDKTESIDDIGK